MRSELVKEDLVGYPGCCFPSVVKEDLVSCRLFVKDPFTPPPPLWARQLGNTCKVRESRRLHIRLLVQSRIAAVLGSRLQQWYATGFCT
ncbi:hypothetical protein Taro_024097 [Colocasia esculenta]|uniref:Uncharacterized protein n=1 Tax=Colocasia esculenta TaxID=4460 RepID=A0A843V6J1_COLES|nr:hypothetical protein [Colocasia esculenta]